MNVRHIFAIYQKQLKDTFKNKGVLIQFIIFPLVAFIMDITIGQSLTDEGMGPHYFVTLFSIMYAGMAPTVAISSIITEEKEQNTLRVLMMNNVKPMEYLLGVGGYVFTISAIGCICFGFMGGFALLDFLKFLSILLTGVLASILLGAIVGILSKNQMSATSLVLPISMVAAFLPMIALFNESFANISQVLYTQQIHYLINDFSAANYTWDRFAIIGANILLFALIFVFAYRKKSLAD
ncbi:ABC transporter permease [Eubacteriales bacterium OttesenSCG-928-M02]|nr:ABC transporter permease [Eubacteriales bacterium OttesenSCG-928-M02]